MSQQTTALLRTTPTRTISQLETLTHLGHNQQQPFSGLHQPGPTVEYKHWLTWVTTNNIPSQDYTNPDDQPTTNTYSPWSQAKTAFLRTTPSRTISQLQTLTHLGHNQQQSFWGLVSQPTTALLRTTPTRTNSRIQTLTHLGHNQQHSFSGLHQPGRSTNYKHLLTLVTSKNSLSQDCTKPDDQTITNTDSPWSQPTTVLLRTTPTRTISQLQTLTHLCHN